MTDPLIGVRAVHFVAAMLVAGIAVFEVLVIVPAMREIEWPSVEAMTRLRTRLVDIIWAGLAVAVFSGAAWLLFLAARIADRSPIEVLTDGTAWTVLSQTRFGVDWQVRLLVAALLSGCLILIQKGEGRHVARHRFWLASFALVFVGTLAWSGHGGASRGLPGYIHVGADILHLTAASAWLGGLLPLVLWLAAIRKLGGDSGPIFVRDIAHRFSNLGIVAVGTLVASGMINTWFMTGGVWGLIGTTYGRLLLLKIAFFIAMVCVAAVNRQLLLPQLSRDTDDFGPIRAAQRLERNAFIELGLGICVVVIVGVLGIEAPAMGSHNHVH